MLDYPMLDPLLSTATPAALLGAVAKTAIVAAVIVTGLWSAHPHQRNLARHILRKLLRDEPHRARHRSRRPRR